MTGGRSSVLSTIGHEAKMTLRECVGDAVRLAASVLAALLGLAILLVGIADMSPLFVGIGVMLTAAGTIALYRDSAAIAWLRDRRSGRTWRWS
jgi:hypothetical protein